MFWSIPTQWHGFFTIEEAARPWPSCQCDLCSRNILEVWTKTGAVFFFACRCRDLRKKTAGLELFFFLKLSMANDYPDPWQLFEGAAWLQPGSLESAGSFTVDLQTLLGSRYDVTIRHLAKRLLAIGSAFEAFLAAKVLCDSTTQATKLLSKPQSLKERYW